MKFFRTTPFRSLENASAAKIAPVLMSLLKLLGLDLLLFDGGHCCKNLSSSSIITGYSTETINIIINFIILSSGVTERYGALSQSRGLGPLFFSKSRIIKKHLYLKKFHKIS